MEAFYAFGALSLLLPIAYALALWIQSASRKHADQKTIASGPSRPTRSSRQRFRRAHG